MVINKSLASTNMSQTVAYLPCVSLHKGLMASNFFEKPPFPQKFHLYFDPSQFGWEKFAKVNREKALLERSGREKVIVLGMWLIHSTQAHQLKTPINIDQGQINLNQVNNYLLHLPFISHDHLSLQILQSFKPTSNIAQECHRCVFVEYIPEKYTSTFMIMPW